MNNITLNLENAFKQLANNLDWVMDEAKDIHSAYFATDASTLVAALATAGSGASLDAKLTKSQYQNGIGLCEQLGYFFLGSSVTTGDYLNTIDNLIYGNAAVPAFLSPATEALANRLVILSQSCLTHFITAKDLLESYNNSELSVIVAGVSGARQVYGANMNVTQLTQGITLVEQFKKLVNNEAVATARYADNVAIWKMI